MEETRREASACAFLCKVSSSLKLPTFRQATALQRFWHPGVEEAVGSHEVDLTNLISSRIMFCPKRSPAQDVHIIAKRRASHQARRFWNFDS